MPLRYRLLLGFPVRAPGFRPFAGAACAWYCTMSVGPPWAAAPRAAGRGLRASDALAPAVALAQVCKVAFRQGSSSQRFWIVPRHDPATSPKSSRHTPVLRPTSACRSFAAPQEAHFGEKYARVSPRRKRPPSAPCHNTIDAALRLAHANVERTYPELRCCRHGPPTCMREAQHGWSNGPAMSGVLALSPLRHRSCYCPSTAPPTLMAFSLTFHGIPFFPCASARHACLGPR